MQKYLVQIEFRYLYVPKNEMLSTNKNKFVTIGVYDTFEQACENGNKLLETLESKFELHTFPSGIKATKERVSLNGGAYRSKKDLITDLAYLKTPFSFFAKITTLNYLDIDETINEVLGAGQRYREYKTNLESL